MSIAAHLAILFAAMTPDDLDLLTPAERQRFAELCRRWADRADRAPPPEPRAGVLGDLHRGPVDR